MSESSDRIRAALSKSNSGIRRPIQIPDPKPVEETQPSVAISEEALAFLGEDTPEPAAVETTLPLVAATDEERVAEASVEEVEEEAVEYAEEPVEYEEEASVEEVEPVEEEEPAAPVLRAAPELFTRAPILGMDEASESKSSKLFLIIGAAVLLVAGVAAYFIFGGSSSGPGTFPLQLAVEPQGNGLMNIRWNPQSKLIVQASEGRLVVKEKDQEPKVIALQPAQLKIGHVYYQSPAERLEFRLEVIDREGKKAEESVMALSSGTAAAAVPTPAPAPVSTPAATTQEANTTPQTAAGAAPALALPEPPTIVKPADLTPKPATRQFSLPVQQNQAANASPTIIQDAPVAAPTPAAVPPGIAGADAPSRIQAAAPPPPAAPKEPAKPVGGNVERAMLIKRTPPIYPPLARTARIQGTVRFNATISKTGTVTNLQLINGPNMLVQAASDAVKQWVYRPMMLNGTPVEVITQVEVTFTLTQ